MEYQLTGNGPYGRFDVFRSEKEFVALRRALCVSWPGFYVPPVPTKDVSTPSKREHSSSPDEDCLSPDFPWTWFVSARRLSYGSA